MYFLFQASEDLVERLPIIHHNDELRTQTSKIILRYPLSSSSAPRVRHLGQKTSEKRYTTAKTSRHVRNNLPLNEPKYLPYQSSKTAVNI